MSEQLTAYGNFHLQFLAGQWREGRADGSNQDLDPYSGELLTTINQANRQDVDETYWAADKAQRGWAEALPAVRMAVLEKAAQLLAARQAEIIDWLVRESGSSQLKGQVEVGSALNILKYSVGYPLAVEGKILASNVPGQESRVYRSPLGVVGIISPWNFPFHLTMRSLAPALALGNAVVIKPASDTPISGGLWLAKLFEEAGLPAGVLSVVIGSGREIGDYFVEHQVPRFISFTGSTEVGRGIGRIACGGKYIKRVALELGGNAPFVVLAGADVEQAAQAALAGRFLHQGQICMSTNRVIVEASVHDAFVEAAAARLRNLPFGDPKDPKTIVGPLINQSQAQDVKRRLEQAVKDGATVVVGNPIEGNVVPPHLLTGVSPDWSIAVDETFGPLLPVIKARDEAHALELANASEFGLSSAVFSGDLERGVRFARNIVAGMTHVNGMSVDDQPNAPFGGEKNSGLGRFNGQWALEEFTRAHWITVQSTPREYPF